MILVVSHLGEEADHPYQGRAASNKSSAFSSRRSVNFTGEGKKRKGSAMG
jgi:hypothetical protein